MTLPETLARKWCPWGHDKAGANPDHGCVCEYIAAAVREAALRGENTTCACDTPMLPSGAHIEGCRFYARGGGTEWPAMPSTYVTTTAKPRICTSCERELYLTFYIVTGKVKCSRCKDA